MHPQSQEQDAKETFSNHFQMTDQIMTCFFISLLLFY